MEKKNLEGMRFGKLVAVEQAFSSPRGVVWKCKCDCGNETNALCSALINGHKKSCGCFVKETASKVHTKHGKRKERIYHIWKGITQRCNNPNQPAYPKYGGRGITVCKEWEQSFEAFYKWSMENGYNDTLTIERINVNGNYCPENCCWADYKTQQNNRTNNRLITFGGKTKTLAQWSETTGISSSALLYRIKSGWSMADVLQTPLQQGKSHRMEDIP